MSGKRYPEEFKIEAVKQVVDRGYSVASVATRLDIATHSLYARIKYGPDSSTNKEQSDAQADPPAPEGAEAGYRRTGHIKSRGVLRKAVRLSTPLSTTAVAGLFVCSVGCWMFIPVALRTASAAF